MRHEQDEGNARRSVGLDYERVVKEARAPHDRDNHPLTPPFWAGTVLEIERSKLANNDAKLSRAIEAHAWPRNGAFLIEGRRLGIVLVQRGSQQLTGFDFEAKRWRPIHPSSENQARAAQWLSSARDAEILSMESEGDNDALDGRTVFLSAITEQGVWRQVVLYESASHGSTAGRLARALMALADASD